MAENPSGPVTRSQIANHIGIATICKPPVNPLSNDVCAGLTESLDEFEKAKARVVIIRADPNSKIWSAGHDVHEIHSTATTPCTGQRGLSRFSNASGTARCR